MKNECVHPEKDDYMEDMRKVIKIIGGIGELDEE